MTSSYRRRQKQIAEVMVRYEMGHLLEILGLERFASFERRLLRRPPAHTRPESLRLALEELGPTFVKLGQALSARPDVLPPDFQAELVKLQDNTIRVRAELIYETIASELGAAATELFATFETEPLAAASIGQVHAATLHDGTDVVVKVRRPDAAEQVELDLEILRNLAARADQRWQDAERWDLSGLVRGLADLMRAELDYLQEAANAQEFAADFGTDPLVHIPSVYPELTTSRVITLERLWGTRIGDVAGLDAGGVDRAALARRFAAMVAQMVLVNGFFHGDPHPGNFFVEPGGRIGIVDFGRVGRIDESMRSRLSGLVMALVRKDPERLTKALLALGVSAQLVDRERLRLDVSEMLSRYGGHPIHQVPIRAALTDTLDVVRRHNLTISPDLALLFAVLVMDESITEELDSDFRFDDVLRPYVESQLASSLSPLGLARRAEEWGIDVAEMATALPGQLHRLLEVIGDGQFEIHLRARELQPLVQRIERLANRVSLSIVAAAAIDGLSELAAHNHSGRSRRRSGRAAGVGVITSVAVYTLWRRSGVAAVLDTLRPHRLISNVSASKIHGTTGM